MGYAKPQVVEDFLYTLNQCKNCGDWLNDKGIVDLTSSPKIKTVGGVYCKYCKTALQRKIMATENEKLFKKNERIKRTA